MSWRPSGRLQDVSEDKKFYAANDLKTYLEDVFKRYIEDVLKSFLEDVFKTPWRQTKWLLEISVSNKPKSVSNKSISHKSLSEKPKGNPKCIN